VIIDKVVVHQTHSTLIVLGIALVMFMLFTSGMTWLRQYLVLHTGNRIDAVLGSRSSATCCTCRCRTSNTAPPAPWSPACTASKPSASSSPAPPSP
jgi:ABC-type protease/lipase transport system fused ATPase/permease subunit